MACDITILKSRAYLIVRVKGPMTVDLAGRMAVDATGMGRRENINSVLYDLRDSSNVESTLSNYQFVYQNMKGLGLDRSVRVAALTSPDDRSHDFVETLTRNAGYVARLFKDEESAGAWLEKEAGEQPTP